MTALVFVGRLFRWLDSWFFCCLDWNFRSYLLTYKHIINVRRFKFIIFYKIARVHQVVPHFAYVCVCLWALYLDLGGFCARLVPCRTMYYLLVECLYSFLVFLIISHILLVNKTVIVSTLCIVTMGHNLWHVMEYLGCFRLCLAPIRFAQKKEKRSWKDSLRKSYEKFLLYGCPWKSVERKSNVEECTFCKMSSPFFFPCT